MPDEFTEDDLEDELRELELRDELDELDEDEECDELEELCMPSSVGMSTSPEAEELDDTGKAERSGIGGVSSSVSTGI